MRTGAVRAWMAVSCAVLAAAWSAPSRAAGLADALSRAEADLALAERYAADVAARVAAERAVLAAEVDSLEAWRAQLEQDVAALETRKKDGVARQQETDARLTAAEEEYRDLSGTIRRAVGDVGALIHRSPLTGLDPGRVEALAPLLDRNRLPEPADLSKLAGLVFDELARSSEVRLVRATIVARDGTDREADVVAIGRFNPVYRDGEDVGFLAYTHQSKKLVARSAQPPRSLRGDMKQYLAGKSDRAPVDISTGGAKRVARQLTTAEQFVALLPMLWPYVLVGLGMVVIGVRTHRRAVEAGFLQRVRHSLREVFPIALALTLNGGIVAFAVVKGGAERKPELVEVALVGLDAPEPPVPPEEIVEPAPAADLAPSDATNDVTSAPAPAFTAADFGEPDFSGPDASGMGGLGLAAGDLAYGLGGGTPGAGGGGAGGRHTMIFESFQLDQSPRPVVKTPPAYPFKAREQGTEGVVQVKILVRDDGGVGEVLIVDSRPKDIFDDAVLAAVPQWRFEPGVIDGRKVTSWVVTALRFELN